MTGILASTAPAPYDAYLVVGDLNGGATINPTGADVWYDSITGNANILLNNYGRVEIALYNMT